MGKFWFKYLAYKGVKIISAYDFMQNNQKLHTEQILWLKLEIGVFTLKYDIIFVSDRVKNLKSSIFACWG